MKVSSKLFFQAIIVEFLENHNFILKQTPIAYIYERGDIKVKIGDKVTHIYDMSQKVGFQYCTSSVGYHQCLLVWIKLEIKLSYMVPFKS